MSYYRLGKRRLISDIFSPFSGKGYNVEHPGVKKQPIGALNSRYLRRNARISPPEKTPVAQAPNYTFVPPLTSLHQEETQPVYSRRLKLAVPILLLAIALIWLLSLHQPAKVNHGIGAQTIPIIQTTSANSSGSSGGGSRSPKTAPTSSPTTATNISGSGSPSNLGVPSSGVTGGRGGVGSTSGSGSGSTGTLPLTLTVPPTNLSAGGKQILDSGGTTITVN